MAYFHSTAILTGGSDVDYMFGTSAISENTISGGYGNDLIVGDLAAVVPEAIGNTSIALAQKIDNDVWWSTTHNPLIDSSQEAIPHTLVYGGNENGAEYYQVTVEDGAKITVDIDWATFDTFVQILDKNGQVVAENDDSAITLGGGGSISTTDSFVSYASTGGDTFYIRVYNANFPQEYRVDGQFVMNVIVEGHDVGVGLNDAKDVINGGVGDDLIYGTDGNDTIEGGFGNDMLYGGDGDDYLDGGDGLISGSAFGSDTIYGEGGDDVIAYTSDQFYSAEFDTIDGGDGVDELVIENITNQVIAYTVDLANGIVQESFSATYMSIANIENVTVTGSFEVLGDAEDNEIRGTGLNGNNYFAGGDGNDTFYGGGGHDTLVGDKGIDHFYGENDNDTIRLNHGDVNGQAEIYNGGAGIDTIQLLGSNGSDFDLQQATIFDIEVIKFGGGGTNNDLDLEITAAQVFGTGGLASVQINGNQASGSQEDIMVRLDGATGVNLSGWTFANWGGQGDRIWIYGDNSSVGLNETITGSSEYDRIYSYAGDDVINAGDGDDYIVAGAGADTVNGGLGTDTLSFVGASAAVDVSLLSGGIGGDAAGDTYTSIEIVDGTSFDDRILGNSAANILNGFSGNDSLYGGFGVDTLNGGNGDDYLSGGSDNDTLSGHAGDDVLSGGFGADLMDGGSGIDTVTYQYGAGAVTIDLALGTGSGGQAAGDFMLNIENVIGTAYDDSLIGNNDDNVIQGLAGADTIDGGLGNDTASYVLSGAGVNIDLFNGTASGGDAAGDALTSIENLIGSSSDDTLIGSSGANVLTGGEGNDTLAGGLGNDTLYGGEGDDVIYTGNGNNTATGDKGADTIFGGTGVDVLDGGSGNDTIYGRDGNDDIIGGVGDDTLIGEDGDDTIDGGDGADTLNGGNGDDTLDGGGGGDTFYAGAGSDTINGGDGDDTIIAEGGLLDTINAGNGNDTAYGGAGANTGDMGAGDDIYIGAGDVDDMNGGTGADVLYGYAGADTLRGGDGNDFIVGGDSADNLYGDGDSDTISAGAGNDDVYGGTGTDLVYAGDGHDTVEGGDGNDTLFAGAGNDMLLGGAGNDRLYGQANTNLLYGGAGDDNYYGGTSDDTFQFNAADGASVERVSFFNLVDTVQLNGFGFADAAAASSSFVQSGANVIFNSGGVQIVFYSANVGQVRSRVQVDGLMELPSDKALVLEDVTSQTQDLIAEFLNEDRVDVPIESFDDYGILSIRDDDGYHDWDIGVLA